MYVDTSPELFTATQKLEEGHDTEAKLPFGSIDRGTDHVMVVAVAVVVVVVVATVRGFVGVGAVVGEQAAARRLSETRTRSTFDAVALPAIRRHASMKWSLLLSMFLMSSGLLSLMHCTL